jgi:hypothetical protein
MKFLLAALVLLAPVAAAAASPEEAYFAARDDFVAKFSAIANIGEEDLEDHQRARNELTGLLRPIVGPVAIRGLLPQGRTNLDSLFKGDEGFGLLDGLLFSSADDKTHVVVTTDALFDRWLKEHKDWWGPKVANVPQDVVPALKSEAFYTQALMTDAAVMKYAELPVTKPANTAFAFAMLVARAQEVGPRPPDELIVSVVRGGRVFVASAPANAKINPMPACRDVWRAAERKTAAAHDAYAASEPKDDKLLEQATRLEGEGDAAFRSCYAQRAKRQGSYAVLTKRAQALVDLLAPR